MYNLTVDEAHTFFVGDGQWLVHNALCDRIYDLINKPNLNYDDISTLIKWTEKDIRSTPGIQVMISPNRGSNGWHVNRGESPLLTLYEPDITRTTWPHEWWHFDTLRSNNWATDYLTQQRLSAQDHLEVYEWQLRNIDAIFGGPRNYTDQIVTTWQFQIQNAIRQLEELNR